jgi:hypothetical protein
MNRFLIISIGITLGFCIGIIDAGAKEWEVLKSNSFIVYYRSSVPEDFVKTVLDSAQENFRRVVENLGAASYKSWNQNNRASIYIYADQEDYIHSGNQASWSHGSAMEGSKVIKTFPSDEGFFDTLLPHELGHIILREYLGPDADIPLWFNEGVAMNQEKAKRLSSNKIVQEAIAKGQYIPLTQLTDMRLYKDSDKEKVKIFYAESASIVFFMVNQLGENRFYKLCRELKERTRFVDALSKVYVQFNGLDGLNKKWMDYLKEGV